ncbi:MAG TPA: hypothetical protein VHX11_01750 [Acidobacteriaceae bacterium]|jgi:hypothetical protein|nr:hypothetical protein [Acidobacteriaceae bacterium]
MRSLFLRVGREIANLILTNIPALPVPLAAIILEDPCISFFYVS